LASPHNLPRLTPCCDGIVTAIRATDSALKTEGATRLAIFGWRSRGDSSTDGDLDVLVEIDPASRCST
jgi:predicted nucleotidyltransferase